MNEDTKVRIMQIAKDICIANNKLTIKEITEVYKTLIEAMK